MASMYGADPDQLDGLGTTFQRQTETINSLMNLVSGALSGTTWVGPAREQFEGDWNGSFKTALAKMIEAFNAAGTDCKVRATNLRTVMGQYATA